MKKILEYRIISDFPTSLESRVQRFIDRAGENWEPLGPPVLSGSHFNQAIVKYEIVPDEVELSSRANVSMATAVLNTPIIPNWDVPITPRNHIPVGEPSSWNVPYGDRTNTYTVTEGTPQNILPDELFETDT